jgi:chaperonin GroES
METRFVPNGRRYLVLLDEQKGDTIQRGGLTLTTDPEKHRKPTSGTVIAVGDGYDVDAGMHMTLKYSIGARLVFGKYAGVDYKTEKGQECSILSEAEILGEEVPIPFTEECPACGNPQINEPMSPTSYPF